MSYSHREIEDLDAMHGLPADSFQSCACGWHGPKAALIPIVAEDKLDDVLAGEAKPTLICPRCGLSRFLDGSDPRMPFVEAGDRMFQLEARHYTKVDGTATTWLCRVERDEKLSNCPLVAEYERLCALEQSLSKRLIISIKNSEGVGMDADETQAMCLECADVGEKVLKLKWEKLAHEARARAFTAHDIGLVVPVLIGRGYFGIKILVHYGPFRGAPWPLSELAHRPDEPAASFNVPGVGRVFVAGFRHESQPAPGDHGIDDCGRQAIAAICKACGWCGDRNEFPTALLDGGSWSDKESIRVFCPKCQESSVEFISDLDEPDKAAPSSKGGLPATPTPDDAVP